MQALLRTATVLIALAQPGAPLAAPETAPPLIEVAQPLVGPGVRAQARRHLDLAALRAALVSALRASERLRLPDPDGSPGAAIDGQAGGVRPGQATPAYRLVPRVAEFSFDRMVRALPNFASKFRREDAGLLRLTVRMIDRADDRPIATFGVSSRFATKPRIVASDGGAPDPHYFTGMAEDVGHQLAERVVATLFPLKVVGRTGGDRVVINRGAEAGMVAGATFDVFADGQRRVDAGSDPAKGDGEGLVGRVQLMDVQQEVSHARILVETEPFNRPIAAGDILRPSQTR